MIRSSLILLAILTTCFKDETVSGQTTETDVWVLQSMNAAPVTLRITITFPKEGRIAGQAPCNRYFANQTVPLPWFAVEQLGATKMACAALDLEAQYFTLLQKMTTAEPMGSTLILRGEAQETLVFTKE